MTAVDTSRKFLAAFKSFGIRGRLISFFLMFGVIPAAVVLAILLSQESFFRTAMSTRVLDVATQVNDVIDRNLFERYGDVQAFALNRAASNPKNWRNASDQNPLISAMNGYMKGYGIYKLMLLVDTQGRVLATNTMDPAGRSLDTGYLYGKSFADAQWFRNAISGNFLNGKNGLTGTVVEQPSVNAEVARIYNQDGYTITFAAPVRDENGQVVAVWANFTDFSLVEAVVASYYDQLAAYNMASAEIVVLDPEGRIIVDYDPTYKGFSGLAEYKRNFDTIGKMNLATGGVEAAERAVKGETGLITSMNIRKKVEQVAGFAYSDGAYDYPGLGWSSLVRIEPREVFATWENMISTMLIAVAAAAAAILVFGYVIGNIFSKPIRSLTSTMLALANGDKTVDIPATNRTDEIGEMARTVEVFKANAIEAERLQKEAEEARRREEEAERRRIEEEQERQRREAAAEEERKRQAEQDKRRSMNELADQFEASVIGVVDAVAAAAERMKTTAETMSAAAEETDVQSASVASAASQASSNVQTVASASEEMASSISEIGRQVTQSSTIAKRAVSEAERTNSRIQSLAEAANKIGDVVDLITNIAGQTNLLALNATIEAARAGEAGKGFAVVASEVKSLANQTAKATDEIAEQITGIQGATTEAVEAIKGISTIIAEINDIAAGIAAAVEQQSAATNEISRNVQEAAQGTEAVTTNIAGVAEAARETGSAASQVLGAATGLGEQASDLRSAVESFVARVRAA